MSLVKKFNIDGNTELYLIKDNDYDLLLSIIYFKQTYTKELLEILRRLILEKIGIEFSICEFNGKPSLVHVLTAKANEFSDKDLNPVVLNMVNKLSNCKLNDLINEAKKNLQKLKKSKTTRRKESPKGKTNFNKF